MKRQSIPPTYDSRETGPRYWVTTWIGKRVLHYERKLDDPFCRTTVVLGWRDLLRGLLHGHLDVVVAIGADPDMVEDVMELDGNYLGFNCTRRDEFSGQVQQALSDVAGTEG